MRGKYLAQKILSWKLKMKRIIRVNALHFYTLVCYSIVATALLVAAWRSSVYQSEGRRRGMVFHGRSDRIEGSCWCSKDTYCLCSPSLAIDAIIEMNVNGEPSVVLVERKDGMGYALVGGFVDVGESVEDATVREIREETSLTVKSVSQFRVYSAPGRDPRRHTVSAIMLVRAEGVPRAADDAKSIVVVPLYQARHMKLAFDHAQVLADYLTEYRHTK